MHLPPKQQELRTKKRMRYAVVLLAALIYCNIAALVVVLLQRRAVAPFAPAAHFALFFNPAKQEKTAAQKISEDMQLISINEAPYFTGLAGEGDLRVEIAKACHYAYRVTYSLAATEEQILKTGLLKPGEYVLRKPLDTTLEQGEYAVTALFTAYDLETQQVAGEAAQVMTFYVEAAQAEHQTEK